MIQSTLAEALRVIRARKGLTLAEASELIGVNRHTLRDLELGKREPYGPTLRKLASGYGVSVEELLNVEAPAPKGDAPMRTGRRAAEADDLAGLLVALGSPTQHLADTHLTRNLEGASDARIAATVGEIAEELSVFLPELRRRLRAAAPNTPGYMTTNRIFGEASQQIMALNMFLRWREGAEPRKEFGEFREVSREVVMAGVGG
jgi:transcriptional regulator with XRE-family HTH domain